MIRSSSLPFVLVAFALVAVASPAGAQSTFKVPFNFQTGGKHLASGSYTVTKTADGQLTFKHLVTGKEAVVPFTEQLKAQVGGSATGPTATPAAPCLVFDEVGDFQPSYTEYITVYVLAEAWLSREDGYRVHVTKGAHTVRIVPAEK